MRITKSSLVVLIEDIGTTQPNDGTRRRQLVRNLCIHGAEGGNITLCEIALEIESILIAIVHAEAYSLLSTQTIVAEDHVGTQSRRVEESDEIRIRIINLITGQVHPNLIAFGQQVISTETPSVRVYFVGIVLLIAGFLTLLNAKSLKSKLNLD